MRPCQRGHYLRKIESYEKQIEGAMITIEEQQKRIACFQGLIKQIEEAMVEAVRVENETKVDKPSDSKGTRNDDD